MKLSARGLMAWVVVLSTMGCECGVPPVDPMSLVIEPAEASVLVGDEVPLRVRRVNGEDVTDLVTWISADGALASVEGGRVRGVSVGQVRVLAQLDLYEAGADVAINARPVSCSDGALNGDETDLDCGGALCAPCAVGLACVAATDCQSSACRDGRCQRPSCTDGVRNGGEAAVDCGGECPGCAPGTACTTNADCSSQLCVNGTCSTPTCSDGARNGTETDVDCGGTCDPCPAGGVCTVDSDCATGVCANGTCAADSCSDGVRNGLETDVDCGGLACTACPTGGACVNDGDCASSLCENGTCAAPSCMDQRRNGDETGPDCGGATCPRCASGFTCGSATDCLSGVCTGDVCQAATCSDGVRNGTETATDCGGASCSACAAGQACQAASDCLSQVCTLGQCAAATCSDGVQNDGETGLDCGGPRCGACGVGQGCTTGSDCVTLACSNGQCVPPSCVDGARNGDETAVDCGGPSCAPCGSGSACNLPGDCTSGVCTANTCAAPSCTDGVRNGGETAVDCGGGTCSACGLGSSCTTNTDCTTGNCEAGTCAAPFITAVEVMPGSAAVPEGRTQRFLAVEVLSDGSRRDVSATAAWSSTDATIAPISASGVLTANRQGQTTVRAVSSNTSSNPVTVMVIGPVVERIEIAPVGVRLPIGLIEAFTATGTFSNGDVRDITTTASWTSTNPAAATIAGDGRATALAAGTTRLIATQDGVSGETELVVTTTTVTALSVGPETLRLPTGVRAALTATALLSDGSARDVTWQASWSSAAPTIATVTTGAMNAGLVTATSAGTAAVSATLAGFTSTSTVTVVNANVTTVQVFPADETVPMGFEVHYAAVGLFDDGNAYDLTLSADWSSSDATVATVGNAWPEQGFVRTVGLGTTRIGATFRGQSGDTGLTVNDATLTSLSLTPALITLPLNLTWPFRATGTFSDGTARDVTALARWSTSNLAVATVSNALGSAGRVYTLTAGSTVVSATLGGRTGNAQVRVTDAALEQVSVSPPGARIGVQGVVSFTAAAIYADGTALDVTELSGWTSSAPGIASVRNDSGFRGVAVGLSPGESTITARFGGQAGQSGLTVTNANLADLYISPAVVRTGLGIDVQFNLSGLWSDGTTADLTRVATWRSSLSTVAVISNAIGSHGLATTRAAGVTTIGASWAGQSDTTTLTVTNARLTSIAVTPNTALTGAGAQLQFRATATFDDGTTFDITRVAAWSSSNDSIASVSGAAGSVGLVTAIQGGTVTITARMGEVSGAASLTVSGAALVGLVVTPTTGLIPRGYWRPYTATAQYADGLTVDVTGLAAWTSSNQAIVRVGNGTLYGGRAQGIAVGTATITARFGTFGGQATATVLQLRLAGLEVTPTNQMTSVGVPVQLSAIGTFTDGTTTFTLDITLQVGWKVAPKKNGTVSNSDGSRGVVTMYNESSSANILAQSWEPTGGTGNTKVHAN